MKPPPEYSKVWFFRTMLIIPQISPDNRSSVEAVNLFLRNQILQARPERVTHIEERYKLDDSSSKSFLLRGISSPRLA
jgi:hypothetical protein